MTKEELIKISRENLRKSKQGSLCECYDEAFIKGYELSEKQIAELEQQIEKMKCCGNCKNEGDYKEPYRYGTGWCNICKRHKVAKGNFDKWEIKEND